MARTVETIDQKMAKSVLPRRTEGAHKWGVGGVFFIAGAPQYAGAVALSARAAGRSGAGIVTLAVPRQLMGIVQTIVPEATMLPIADTDTVAGARRAIESMTERAERSRAYVIGPGLGDDDSVKTLLATIFGVAGQTASGNASLGFAVRQPESQPVRSGDSATELPDHPMVLDADALNWLAGQDDWPALLGRRTAVLTPHPGELARLLDRPVEAITDDPVASAVEAATRTKQVVVLKHGHTVVTDGERVLVAERAPTALATAGSGDVLAGSIGAFLAQGLPPIDAAALAVYAGSAAADRIAERFGDLGVVASDLPDAIAEILAELGRG
ncbi:MAG: NAD(P)H-hydrate epimerase / ADP-dependent (S)-NAD(P)H-hydrate dehydratase [uncultured Thermomicrobiales bacterium]|uniref:ADP-dependent (S)-NAD(P)H-hydrate dehydratase n=1 Tax=uncultured Thermomicrobiales bacterium TaxID=1645740 RepID=A0A6J4V028_9BACT|nr:MAG: NAD(P)H-hydrate epimerase / ADP-dependent (S)-NAD(P)H-hydrate dehydratase [uncultured Thermomicrobiales bacterium]